MARPVQADAAATRARILTAASRLFSERDLGGASIRHIARAADVSVATVHHYFGGKDQLYAACIDAMYVELSGLRETLWAVVGEADVANALEILVHEAFAFGRNHQLELRLLMRQVIGRGELDAIRQEAWLKPFLDQGGALLASRTTVPADTCRLVLQSTTHLIVRYALSTDDALILVAGVDDAHPAPLKEAMRRIENHLVRMGMAELELGRSA